MATKTIKTKVDDIDGSPADASFSFTWQGYKYHIDLSKEHAAELKADFDKWVSAAKRDRGTPRAPRAARPATDAPAAKEAPAKAAGKRSSKSAKTADKPAARRSRPAKKEGPSAAEIRAWAVSQGIPVPDRGRLAPAIVQQFMDALAAA